MKSVLKLLVVGLTGPILVISFFQYLAWRQAGVGEGIYLTNWSQERRADPHPQG